MFAYTARFCFTPTQNNEENNDEIFYNMIDIGRGWVKINKNEISYITPMGKYKDKKFPISRIIKELIIEKYGEYFSSLI